MSDIARRRVLRPSAMAGGALMLGDIAERIKMGPACFNASVPPVSVAA